MSFTNVELALVIGTVLIFVSAYLFCRQLRLFEVLDPESLKVLLGVNDSLTEVRFLQKIKISIRSNFASLLFLIPCMLAFIYAIVMGSEQARLDALEADLQAREQSAFDNESVSAFVKINLIAKSTDGIDKNFDWGKDGILRVLVNNPRRVTYDILPMEVPGIANIKFKLNRNINLGDVVNRIHIEAEHPIENCGNDATRIAFGTLVPSEFTPEVNELADDAGVEMEYVLEAQTRIEPLSSCNLTANLIKEEL